MLISTVFLLVCLLGGINSGSATKNVVKEYQDEVPGHEGQCLGKDHKYYKLGEPMKDEPCTRKVCKGSAQPGSVYMEVEKCPNVKTESGCQLQSHAEENYPNCCSKLVCG